MLKAPDILVPVDFSATSINAVRVAARITEPDGDITLLHVIDDGFIHDAVAAALGTTEEITARVREQAEASFTNLLEEVETGTV
ncbi:MAG: universal stress protein, partial [Pyrinomonadaceae bacterium]